MKPVTREVKTSLNTMQVLTSRYYGSVHGVTKLKGVKYPNCIVVLYLKRNLSPVVVTRSDSQGVYEFRGIPTEEAYFVAAFDPKKLKNAVIQDNRLAR